VYEWNRPEDDDPALRLLDAVCRRRVDAITFTSAAALETFFAIAERHGRADQLRAAVNGPVLPVCVGPVCAGAADRLGMPGLHPERPRLGAMVHWLTAELGRRRRELRLGGTPVVVQGAAITIGGEDGEEGEDGGTVMLTERERAVFELLLAKAGGVVSRAELLRTVWGSAGEPHALEVTVTRLRKKLGAAGPAVQAVLRRGYRLDLG
jgi:uroporphyrinogen-III synthase